MGVSCFIVFDKPANFDTFVNGKALGAASELLTELADVLKVKSLNQYFSMSADDIADAMDDFDLPDEPPVSPEQWFSPQEISATVRSLALHISEAKSRIPDADAILSDLAEFDVVLTKAQNAGLRCHLSIHR